MPAAPPVFPISVHRDYRLPKGSPLTPLSLPLSELMYLKVLSQALLRTNYSSRLFMRVPLHCWNPNQSCHYYGLDHRNTFLTVSRSPLFTTGF